MPQFPIWFLHWSQISFPRAFFSGQQTNSSCWGPDLENKVGAEAIWCAIHIVLPMLQSTCDTVHCLGERALFSSSFVAIFLQFLPSNTPLMLYDICYWCFFLSQRNQGKKNTVQNTVAKTLPSNICVFGCFGRLSPIAVHSANCRFDSRLKWWIHLSFIVTYLCKNSFLLC